MWRAPASGRPLRRTPASRPGPSRPRRSGSAHPAPTGTFARRGPGRGPPTPGRAPLDSGHSLLHGDWKGGVDARICVHAEVLFPPVAPPSLSSRPGTPRSASAPHWPAPSPEEARRAGLGAPAKRAEPRGAGQGQGPWRADGGRESRAKGRGAGSGAPWVALIVPRGKLSEKRLLIKVLLRRLRPRLDPSPHTPPSSRFAFGFGPGRGGAH